MPRRPLSVRMAGALALLALACIPRGSGAQAPAAEVFRFGAYYMPKSSVFAHQWQMLWAHNRHAGKELILPHLGIPPGNSVPAMAWQVDAARQAGLTWWIFDAFFSPDSGEPCFVDSLDAFLAAPNREELAFAVMYTNEDALLPVDPGKRLGQFEGFLGWTARLAQERPNYLRIEGRPLVVVWRPELLLGAFAGQEGGGGAKPSAETARRFRAFLRPVLARTFGPNEAGWPVLASAKLPRRPREPALLREMGFAAVIPYNAYRDADAGEAEEGGGLIPYEDFAAAVRENNAAFPGQAAAEGLKAVPCVPSGYDKSAIRAGGRRVTGESDAAYEAMLRRVLADARGRPNELIFQGRPMAVLGAWNEWLNGHAIEPGTLFGFAEPFGRLEAVSRVARGLPFGTPPPVPAGLPQVRLLDRSRLDFPADLPAVFSWIQKPRAVPEGARIAFDRRFRLELPLAVEASEAGATVRCTGTVAALAPGVERLTLRARGKALGKPSWAPLEATAPLPLRTGPFDLTFRLSEKRGTAPRTAFEGFELVGDAEQEPGAPPAETVLVLKSFSVQ